MPSDPTIRQSAPSDSEAILDLYGQTFPDEDLRPLVKELLALGPDYISLAASRDGAIIGHIGLTLCSIDQATDRVGLLAPLAVAPSYQKDGVGSALVDAIFEQAKFHDCRSVLVLGDPAYYSRFGFAQEHSIQPPYPLPEEWRSAWQSVGLINTDHPPAGKMTVPGSWRDRSLWAPEA